MLCGEEQISTLELLELCLVVLLVYMMPENCLHLCPEVLGMRDYFLPILPASVRCFL